MAEEKKKSGIFKWIIVILLLVILGGGGYFAYLKFYVEPQQQQAEKTKKAEEAQKKQGTNAAGIGVDGKLVDIPEFVVNLADRSGRRYLKFKMDVEVSNPDDAQDVVSNMAKIRDAVILLLSSKESDELSSIEGKIGLRKDIAGRVNQVLGGPKVARVYFTDFVIQ